MALREVRSSGESNGRKRERERERRENKEDRRDVDRGGRRHAARRGYKRHSRLVQDLWVIQETPVGIGRGERERRGVRYMLSSQPLAYIHIYMLGLARG